MWTKLVLIGARIPLSVAAWMFLWPAWSTVLGKYARGEPFGEDLLVAATASVLAWALWPGKDVRAKAREQYEAQDQAPPFWFVPTLSAVTTGLLLLMFSVAAFQFGLLTSATSARDQALAEKAATQALLQREQRIAADLVRLVCASASPERRSDCVDELWATLHSSDVVEP